MFKSNMDSADTVAWIWYSLVKFNSEFCKSDDGVILNSMIIFSEYKVGLRLLQLQGVGNAEDVRTQRHRRAHLVRLPRPHQVHLGHGYQPAPVLPGPQAEQGQCVCLYECILMWT